MFAALCTADFELAHSIFVRNDHNFANEFLKKKNVSKFKFQTKNLDNKPKFPSFYVLSRNAGKMT